MCIRDSTTHFVIGHACKWNVHDFKFRVIVTLLRNGCGFGTTAITPNKSSPTFINMLAPFSFEKNRSKLTFR